MWYLTERDIPELRKQLSSLESQETFTIGTTLVFTMAGGSDMARYYGTEAHGVSQACPRPSSSVYDNAYDNLYYLDSKSMAAARNGTFEQFRSQVLLSPTLEQSATTLRQDQLSYDCYLSHGLWRDFEDKADAAVIVFGIMFFLIARSLTKQVNEKRDTLHRLVEKVKAQGSSARLFF